MCGIEDICPECLPQILQKYDCHVYKNCKVDYFGFKFAAISKLKQECVKNRSVCETGFDQQDLCFFINMTYSKL